MSQFSLLIEKISNTSLPFVLIGGHAVNCHGYDRQTADLDLMVCIENRTAWLKALAEWGYEPYHQTDAFIQSRHREEKWPDVDLMTVNESTFGKISSDAKKITFGGMHVLVPSVHHMIALKLHAWRNGSEHRKNKDWDDIASMMEACAVDIRDPGFKMLVERYGGPHAWQKISKSF